MHSSYLFERRAAGMRKLKRSSRSLTVPPSHAPFAWTQVYRKKWVIHIERLTREKANGQAVNVGICPSKVQIIKIKEDKDRKALIERKKVIFLHDPAIS